MSASGRRQTTSEGVELWNVSYRFTVRERSWNELFRPNVDPPRWEKTGPEVYEPADFNQLPR